MVWDSTSAVLQPESVTASGTALTPGLSPREREIEVVGELTSVDLQIESGSASGTALTPALSRGEREIEIGGGGDRTWEQELRKKERTLVREIESLKAQGEPDGELMNEMLAASAELRACLETYRSRSP